VDKLRQAAQQALDLLIRASSYYDTYEEIAALEAALTEPVQEPVLVVEKEPSYWTRGHFCEGEKSWIDPIKVWSLPIGTKLYSKPQPRREVELTANAILHLMPDSIPAAHDGALIEFARAVIAAYRAKQGEQP
jgi:hypothetical protein